MTIVLGRRGAILFVFFHWMAPTERGAVGKLRVSFSEARLTLTELPVLGDDLAEAGVAVAGVGAVAVDAAAFAFARLVVALVHVYMVGREGEKRSSDNGLAKKSNKKI